MSSSKRVLRVLHLASFAGNTGDLANHAGTRRMMTEQLTFSLEFTNLEIREFYWKQRSFDDAFVQYANGFDLLIVGGGNYFELWVEHSATGTSIDITPEHLAKLKVPTLFFALGVDTGQGYSEKAITRFAAFIETVLARHDLFVCVRNDGSTRALREVLGEETSSRIPCIPDGGFFADPFNGVFADVKSNRIGINIAGDMLDRRFDRGFGVENFLRELADSCIVLMDIKTELHIELIPHIWRDCTLIARLLPMFPDPYLRRRIAVSRLDATETGLANFLDTYRGCDLVLGMRFHSNVCPIGMCVPSRGLLSYPQVEYLYEEMDMSDRAIDVRHTGFGAHLIEGVLTDLVNLQAERERCLQRVSQLRKQTHSVLAQVDEWLHRNVD